VGEEPEEKREDDAEEQAGDDREVESGVFAAMDDVAGEFSKAKRQLAAKIKKSAEKNQKTAQEKESPSQLAKRFHD